MTTKLPLHDRYLESARALNLRPAQLAKILNLGVPLTPAMRSTVHDKLRGAPGKGVTKAEALLMQLLCALDQMGIAVDRLCFDEEGRLLALPYKTAPPTQDLS